MRAAMKKPGPRSKSGTGMRLTQECGRTKRQTHMKGKTEITMRKATSDCFLGLMMT